VQKICAKNNILIILDATRAMENAWFIQRFESGHEKRSCRQILKDICDLTDGCTMSGKKDLLVNIGGFLALRNHHLYEKACELVVVYEGLHTYGGMSGRDMEAMSRGIEEAIQDEHLSARIRQVHYLGEKIESAGVPVVKPFGGHAIYLDAARFLPHLEQDQFPAQALSAALYIHSGVRSMERGVVSAGRNKITGRHNYPKLELVRLTIPRRVYTLSHMNVVAKAVIELYEERSNICGLEMTYEPDTLRFFQAHFRPIIKKNRSCYFQSELPEPVSCNIS
jgi:tyrosine phenol-lyase